MPCFCIKLSFCRCVRLHSELGVHWSHRKRCDNIKSILFFSIIIDFYFYLNSLLGWEACTGSTINYSSFDVSSFSLTYPLYTALLSDWRVSDSSALAYLRERTCELDIGAYLHCKDLEDLLCALGIRQGCQIRFSSEATSSIFNLKRAGPV